MGKKLLEIEGAYEKVELLMKDAENEGDEKQKQEAEATLDELGALKTKYEECVKGSKTAVHQIFMFIKKFYAGKAARLNYCYLCCM